MILLKLILAVKDGNYCPPPDPPNQTTPRQKIHPDELDESVISQRYVYQARAASSGDPPQWDPRPAGGLSVSVLSAYCA